MAEKFFEFMPSKVHLVSARSLRYGAAMAVLEAGGSETEIKIVGRWSTTSHAFLTYLRNEAKPWLCIHCASAMVPSVKELYMVRTCSACATLLMNKLE